MKRNFITLSVAVVFAFALLSSCKKSSSSSLTTSQVSFGVGSDSTLTTLATNHLASFSTTSVTSANVTWTSGTANIASFKLEAKKHNLEVEITSKDLTHVDLFAVNPALISTTIDTGTFKEIEIRVTLLKSTTAAIPLTLKGTFSTVTGVAVPIEFDFNDDAVIKSKAENVIVDGATDLSNTISFHLNKLLYNVSAQEIDATTRTNNTILISPDVNTDLYNKIKANLISCGHSRGFEKHEKHN